MRNPVSKFKKMVEKIPNLNLWPLHMCIYTNKPDIHTDTNAKRGCRVLVQESVFTALQTEWSSVS